MPKKDNSFIDIVRRIIGTLYIPLIIYFVIFVVARVKGLTFFGDLRTWQNLVQSTAATATIAYALCVQIKSGRFDFSGGAVMTLGAIISVSIVKEFVVNWLLFLVISIIVCTILSFLVGVLYVYGRLPVIIATIGAAILYESFTLYINHGRGISISATSALNFLGKDAVACVVLVAVSGLLHYFYTNFTISGKHALLLKNNQHAAVNIGIKEGKNVLESFVLTGVLYGIAAVIFASQSASVSAIATTLGTINTAFGAILPVFMGFYIGRFSKDSFGIIFSAFAVGTLKYGLSIIAPEGYAGAYTNIIYGLFLVVFFLISHQGAAVISWCKEKIQDSRQGQKA